jgi:hypothetical protein
MVPENYTISSYCSLILSSKVSAKTIIDRKFLFTLVFSKITQCDGSRIEF